jgi:primosomal protein N'
MKYDKGITVFIMMQYWRDSVHFVNLVFGSAAPLLESWAKGKYRSLIRSNVHSG